MLARSNHGVGSLKVWIEPDGVHFSTELPNTVTADEVLEWNKRGDMVDCSFAFVSDRETEEWGTDSDGTVTRRINKLIWLHDLSLVTNGYYAEPKFSTRSIEKYQELIQDMQQEKRNENPQDPQDASVNNPEEQKEEEVQKPENEETKEDKKPEDPSTGEAEPENEETKDAENDDDNAPADPSTGDPESAPDNSEDEPEDDKDEKEDEKEDEADDKEKRSKKINHNIMEKRFSILSAVRSIANGTQMDEATKAVINAGADEMRKAGVAMNGQIQIPVENRAAITVAAEGEDVVVTDFANILEPLRTKNVLADAGANIMTGLVGDLQIPYMGAENVAWEGETTSAKDGAGEFGNVKLTPHRLSAYIDVSKQFLVQDSLGAEALIRKDLVNAIQSKLEATIFSNAAKSGNVPAGIFAGKTPTNVNDFAALVNLESDVEDANFYGEAKYVVSPKAKAAMRAMAKSTKSTQLVLEGDNIDGTPYLSTGHMANPTFAYGDFSQLYVGQWGAVDLTVDPYTKAADGQVRIVINAFFDFKVVRDGAIVYGTTAKPSAGSNG
jgi:HK97 family phage major capsid protein